MTVKDVIKYAAVYLGLEKAVGYLEGEEGDENVLCAVDTLTRCLNLVVNELACSYIPMIKTETARTEDGKVYFSSLSESVLRINGVYLNGEKVYYKLFPEYIKTDFDEVQVEYGYLPANYGLNDEIGYGAEISPRVIAYGVAAEYSITVKAFSEAVMWRERYEKAVSLSVDLKSGRLKGRAFI